jgi:CheY-like chemotaxis protein
MRKGQTHRKGGKMRRILIVDDQLYTWPKLRLKLIRLGYEVVRSDSEANAEQLIAEFQPQLVLLNLLQDNINTWEFFNKLHDQWPALPIINYSPVDMDAHQSLIEAVNEVFRPQTQMRFPLKRKKATEARIDL